MKRTRNMEPDAKIGIGEHLAYGFGGSSYAIISALFSSYLLIYYTMVVGVDTILATGVLAASKLFDGISDLVMGYVIGHTKSKYGKAKPWIFRFIVPTVICTILGFSMPHDMGRMAQIIWIFVTYNLANTICFTAINVSINALNGLMTTNQASRGLNGGLIMLFNTIFSVLIATTILQLTRVFGGGEVYSQRGWTFMAAIYCCIYVAGSLICHFFTHERVKSDSGEQQSKDKSVRSVNGEKIGLGKMLLSLFTNKYWVIAVLVGVAIMMFMSISSSTVVYFAQFVLEDVDMQSTLNSFLSIGMVPSLLISIALMPKLGKRNLMLIGMTVNLVGCIMPLISYDYLLLNVSSVVKGLGYGFAAAPMGSLVQDTITYGEWKNGFNNVGMGNAANSFAMKIGTSVGTILTGFLLDASGFIEKSLVQPESALNMMRFMFIGVPAIAAAVCVILLLMYTLDKTYPKIEADLKAGRYAPGILDKKSVPENE